MTTDPPPSPVLPPRPARGPVWPFPSALLTYTPVPDPRPVLPALVLPTPCLSGIPDAPF